MRSVFLSITVSLMFFCTGFCVAQHESILDQYVEDGLRSNLGLQQLNADFERSVWALKEAKRLYGPTVDFISAYTRNFREPLAIPPPDPANPSSIGLHQMLANENSPLIEDDNLYFPPREIYQSGIQLTQTLYSPELAYNKIIKQEKNKASEVKLEEFRQQLDADIRIAYFRFLQARQVVKSYEEALRLANESLQATEKLIQNQKSTKDVLYKAKANVSSIISAKQRSDNDALKAKYYFNFLLGRDLHANVSIDSNYMFNPGSIYSIRPAGEPDALHYSLQHLNYQVKAMAAQSALIKSNNLPDLHLKAFGGVRGAEFDLDNNQFLRGQIQLSLKWNLFNASANRAKYKQSEYQRLSLVAQHDLLTQQIVLQDSSAYQDIQSQLLNFNAVRDAYQSATIYLEAIRTKFAEGMANILDLTDAENSFTKASIDRELWYYELLIKVTEYKRATGKSIIINQETR